MRIEHFFSYSISADLYVPADIFRLELANPETPIQSGMPVELYVNGVKELTGLIDKVARKVAKSGVSLTVEGRDLMGLLIDSHCEPPWISVEGMKLKTLAELLFKNVPFINRKEILYQENVVGKLKGKKGSTKGFMAALDDQQRISQIEPGMTIFDVLKNYSLSRGMLFYTLPDGTLVFGRPMVQGAADYALIIRRDGRDNNVIESELITDYSRRYSKVTIIGQQQGSEDDADAADINTSGTAIDATFPFYKPYVARDNNDNVSPAMRARFILEKQRREGIQLNYLVGRHSKNNKNWGINTFCRIVDEVQGIDGDYLIYGRTFEMNKQNGPTTRLRLGEPGLVA